MQHGVQTFFEVVSQYAGGILIGGWLLILFFTLWITWETYRYLKQVDFFAALQWTFLQILLPDDAEQTPKAMENAIEVWGGIHKDPDLIEELFEGYMLPWYSCELQCTRERARYIMVVPTPQAKFFEGVIYGQYPTAEIKEVEDYTLEFDYQDLEKKFDLYGTEIHLSEDDIYPIRTYREFEDTLAEDDRFIDPHQALVEAFTNIEEGEQFWIQILIKPVAHKTITKWAERGQKAIGEIAGVEQTKTSGILSGLAEQVTQLPGDMVEAVVWGPAGPKDKQKDSVSFRIHDPAQDAAMKGILQKISRTGFKTKMRVIHIAPADKLNKPNISKAIGAFKQFNTYNLNSLMPDPATKTNGPNYILKQTRRKFRKRVMLLNFQWRDFWGDLSGQMLTAEELATLYHFPIKYVKAPAIERGTAGLSSPPENVPYV